MQHKTIKLSSGAVPEFEHANVANVVNPSEGFDANTLTPADFSTRSQALQCKDGKFKHAFFVTAASNECS